MASIAATLLACVLATTVHAAPPSKVSNPDFTKGEPIPEGATHDWNLGPTGARGWIYSNKLETSQARQIMVTKVDPGSPADGILRPGDVILGAACSSPIRALNSAKQSAPPKHPAGDSS
jgi:S1-C subfamily serine protease